MEIIRTSSLCSGLVFVYGHSATMLSNIVHTPPKLQLGCYKQKNSDFSSRKVAVVIYIVLLCFYLRDFFDLDFDLLFDFELAVALLLLFLDDDLAAFTEADFDFLELDLVYLDLFALDV